MKRYMPLLVISLLAALFIYMFYRTEKTLVNYLFIKLFSREVYFDLKSVITTVLPLEDFIVYSLPEGLWVLSITVTSSYFYVEVQNRKLNLAVIPVLLALLMEFFQLLGITNGRFDIIDIVFAVVFWLAGLALTRTHLGKEPILKVYNLKAICCIASYSIVYLAHVMI